MGGNGDTVETQLSRRKLLQLGVTAAAGTFVGGALIGCGPSASSSPAASVQPKRGGTFRVGSAAAYEMDSAQEWYFGPQSKTVVLARATSVQFVPGRRMPVSPIADIALTEWPNGGAVFAAGSVSWTGSLSHNRYTNSVSRVTENVLRRFTNLPKGASILDGA